MHPLPNPPSPSPPLLFPPSCPPSFVPFLLPVFHFLPSTLKLPHTCSPVAALILILLGCKSGKTSQTSSHITHTHSHTINTPCTHTHHHQSLHAFIAFRTSCIYLEECDHLQGFQLLVDWDSGAVTGALAQEVVGAKGVMALAAPSLAQPLGKVGIVWGKGTKGRSMKNGGKTFQSLCLMTCACDSPRVICTHAHAHTHTHTVQGFI